MTTTEQVYGLIKKIGKGRLAQVELTPAKLLREELELDSLDISELLVLTEDAFDIKVNLDDIESMATVAEMVAYIEAKCAA
jgi:acyl carrier protein